MENNLERRIEEIAKKIQIVANNYDQIEDFTVDYIIKDINDGGLKTAEYLVEVSNELRETLEGNFFENFDRDKNNYSMSKEDLEMYDEFIQANNLINKVRKIEFEIRNIKELER